VFTASYGRVALIAKGARRPKSPLRGILNPFQALRLSWSGRGELGSLRAAESTGPSPQLTTDRTMAGFYVNELLIKLLQRHDGHPELFLHYAALLSELAKTSALEPVLRRFELILLREIGYELNLEAEAISHEPLVETQLYDFRAEQGAVAVASRAEDGYCFTGAELLGVGRLEFDDPATLSCAKRLLRSALNCQLGDRGLQTRKVAVAMKR
jgi:DNA repair protein RecO (recombination protein O)